MRKLLPACIILLCFSGYGQNLQVPYKRHAFAALDTNNFYAWFNSSGNLFSKDTFYSQYPYLIGYQGGIIPKASGVVSVGVSNIWVAGMNNGSLYNSSEIDVSQYQPGPSHLPSADSVLWDKIWLISRTDVLAVRNDFDIHNAITMPVPPSVLDWPAKGNNMATGNGGYSLTITQDMAPFYDRNGDGVYNVYDGDYPMMKGDKMLWWINNDVGSHSTNPMGIDRRYSVYEYNSLEDSNLNNTLFLSVIIRNQSPRLYDSVTIGAFVDFDLGCPSNDEVGCIPSQNSMYVYNESPFPVINGFCFEGTECPNYPVISACNSPIMSATFLNDSMKCFEYYTNVSDSIQADPSTDLGYYRYMNGQWNDGTPVTYAGSGYGGTIPYPYAFPGNPSDTMQWSECTNHSSGDRRSIAAIGPFTLGIGDTISFDMAFIYHAGPYGNCPDLSDSSSVVQHIDSVRRYYHMENFPQWYDSTKSLTPAFYTVGINDIWREQSPSLIPNPNNGSFSIHISNPGQGDYTVSVTDMLGRKVYNAVMYGTDQNIRMDNASSGVYSVTIESKSFRETKKVVITR